MLLIALQGTQLFCTSIKLLHQWVPYLYTVLIHTVDVSKFVYIPFIIVLRSGDIGKCHNVLISPNLVHISNSLGARYSMDLL